MSLKRQLQAVTSTGHFMTQLGEGIIIIYLVVRDSSVEVHPDKGYKS